MRFSRYTTDKIQFIQERVTPEPNSGCWLWLSAYRKDRGYGSIRNSRHLTKQTRAHRFSWEAYRGEIPAGMHVLHKCDTPACVNPDHLFLGTHTDNMRDMTRKGRNRMGRTGRPGEKASRAKLVAAQVLEIRALASDGWELKVIAPAFGVSACQIGYIVRRQNWRHI